jgi:hypothetical protein
MRRKTRGTNQISTFCLNHRSDSTKFFRLLDQLLLQNIVFLNAVRRRDPTQTVFIFSISFKKEQKKTTTRC